VERRQDRQVLAVAIVVIGAAGLLAERSPSSRALEQGVGRVFTPLQAVASRGTAGVTGLLADLQELDTLRQEAEALRAENAARDTEFTKYNDLADENQKLRALLGFQRERVDLNLRGASVVGRKVAEEPGNLLHTIKIDIGRSAGVRDWMPVAHDRGLVGQVVRASEHWSDVLLVTDPNSRVEGRIERSRATGMVFGTATGQLIMRFIPQDSDEETPNVQVGDLVFTSGLSERFPPKIPIGQVVDVYQSDVETDQEALLHPTVNFNALEHVLVVDDWLPGDEDGEPARRPSERRGDGATLPRGSE
jgi:rod shape-determining protein MreC